MAEQLSLLCNELKTIRAYLIKIGANRRQGEIRNVKLQETEVVLNKFDTLKNEISQLITKGLILKDEVTLIDKLCISFDSLYNEILNLCSENSSQEAQSSEKMESFELKTALTLLPVMTDEEKITKQLIDGIEYYDSVLKAESKTNLIQFVLKSRLSQSAKLKLNSAYTTTAELIKDMKSLLLPKKAATAIQSKLQNIRQNNMTVRDFGKEIAELFVDLTISQADGNADSFQVLKPLNEKMAIKRFADGLRNRRLSTIIAARGFNSLKDAVQAAQEEDEVTPGASGEILGMSTHYNTFRQPHHREYHRPREYHQPRGFHNPRGRYPARSRGTWYNNGFRGGPSTYRGSTRPPNRGSRGQSSGYFGPNRGSNQWNRPNIKIMTQNTSESVENEFFRD